MTRIFISYRRDDARYQARIIYDAFCRSVAHEKVFMDINSIPPGANFRKILKGWIDGCEVLLALIGKGWIDAADPSTGLRRLDNPSDFVRIEIGLALTREIPVVPVLLDGAPMPNVDRLPDDLKELVDRQAEIVEYRTFDADVARLIEKLRLGGDAAAPEPVHSRLGPTGSTQAKAESLRAEGRTSVHAENVHGAAEGRFLPGAGKFQWFKDDARGPEMVVVPAGSFTMGSTKFKDEKPLHEVAVAKPFAVGRYAVTFAEWDAAQDAPDWHEHARIAPRMPGDNDWGRGRRPVIDVSWVDATAYCGWLSQVTGKPYRLLSEAEWEYCCRAGTTTAYAFGDRITRRHAQSSHEKPGSAGQTVKVGSFPANAWGLYDTHGNVWEWVADTWHEDYRGAPEDGSVWPGGEPSCRVVRGGSWLFPPEDLRSANRFKSQTDSRDVDLGFRVARTLNS